MSPTFTLDYCCNFFIIVSQTRYISSVSGNGLTVSFTEALEYQHLGETVDLGSGHQLEARAEVGMYSRNIIVRGSENAEWNDEIVACEDGFDAGKIRWWRLD